MQPISRTTRACASAVILTGLAACALLLPARLRAAEIGYNRQVRPLLSDKCFLCHGPDQNTRKAKLRLDIADSALEKKAFVPGKPEESELVRRVFSTDPEQVMPPPESHKTLNTAEKTLLRDWVAQGAKYEPHWAYVPPRKAEVPAGTNAIDFLVRQRLSQLGLTHSPQADRRTLSRRLYFDLVGLPPSPAEVSAFEADAAPDAYQRCVERLLANPHYGERMAIPWLDVARFADTIGYHSDNPRNVWPYRDYVIRVFNENKPFDTFTREQIAGDLLPESGQDQKVGSAFNRLLLTTEEGGAQPKDYEYRMLTDRVRAVGTIWLGQTLGCAACHDHKFDPATMRDFYSLGAFFADIKEPFIGPREPGMLVPDKAQSAQLARLTNEIHRLRGELDKPTLSLDAAFDSWRKSWIAALDREKSWTNLAAAEVTASRGTTLKPLADASVLAEGKAPDKETYRLTFTNVPVRTKALRLEVLPHDSLPGKGPGRAGNGNFVLTEVIITVQRSGEVAPPVKLKSARADIEQKIAAEGNPYQAWVAAASIDQDHRGEGAGWGILPETGKPHYLVIELEQEIVAELPVEVLVELRQNGPAKHTLGHFRVAACSDAEALSGPIAWPPASDLLALLRKDLSESNPETQRSLQSRFRAETPLLAEQRLALAKAEKAWSDYEATIPRCLVTVTTNQPRTVHILPRGDFLKESAGEIVQPALPSYLPGVRSSTPEHRLTRLDLAEWLVSAENPLPARVTMNRLWKHFFGTGLSRVLDDLGAQGEAPANQALLDWLACEFRDSGWDWKHMVRLMVNSASYKQVSTPNPELLATDPYNREIAFQSRWRLEAELVRDNALSLAGLLNLNIGGPSAKPYQPGGYWDNLNFPTRTYEASVGPDQYRRGLYTWWQRSYPHPSLVAFDAPSREECAAERVRSNIPQQALVLLNDPTYVEAAWHFAIRILKEGGREPGARVAWAWREALGRTPQPEETRALVELQAKLKADYERDRASAEAFLKTGGPTLRAQDFSPAELASWANVARAILSLHETITRS